MRIDFNNSINSANIPIINDQKVTVKDAKDAWDYNIVVLCAGSERMYLPDICPTGYNEQKG